VTGRIRHFFAGGNTAQGFYSFYDQIIGVEATRIFIIKGGPGVGKSSFMKALGEELAKRGYDLEYHHCSSDPNSLDGMVIPAIKIAFLDGTAPHIVDPKYPGCVDEILHLGDYWDERKMVVEKAKVVGLTQDISRQFARAYRYLAAALHIYHDWEAVNQQAFIPGIANQKAETLKQELFGQCSAAAVPGRQRHLFASAITPAGPINYLDSIFGKAARMVILTGEPGTGKSTLLGKLLAAAVTCGLSAEVLHCALDPGKIEHLWLPELKTGITTSVWPHTYGGPVKPALLVDMDETLDPVVQRSREWIEKDRREFLALFNAGVEALGEAKCLHDKIEESYVPHMDFAAIDALRQRVLERVLSYANQLGPSSF